VGCVGRGSEQKKNKGGCKSVDDWDGFNVYSVVPVGSGSASGIVTAMTWRHLESEVVGGTCSTADSGSVK
jgi:hypothetical protein